MNYTPKPIDTQNVELSPELLELTEKLAENVHEQWARKRMEEGWRYGEHRDDIRKLTPCLVPYGQLSESEKAYDRETAMETVKVLCKLGYSIQKNKRDGEGKRSPAGADGAPAQSTMNTAARRKSRPAAISISRSAANGLRNGSDPAMPEAASPELDISFFGYPEARFAAFLFAPIHCLFPSMHRSE